MKQHINSLIDKYIGKAQELIEKQATHKTEYNLLNTIIKDLHNLKKKWEKRDY